jgi:hypothetical protein
LPCIFFSLINYPVSMFLIICFITFTYYLVLSYGLEQKYDLDLKILLDNGKMLFVNFLNCFERIILYRFAARK